MAKTDEQLAEMPFPDKGFDDNSRLSAMAPGYTVEAQNVRLFEALTQRGRGGSRAGISKYLLEQVNGAGLIQHMNTIVTTDGQALGATFDPGGSNFTTVNFPGPYSSIGTPASPSDPGTDTGGGGYQASNSKQGGIKFVQARVSGFGSGGAQSLAYSSAVQSGNLLIVAVATFNHGISVAITDSLGNSYQQVNSYSTEFNDTKVSLWWTKTGSSGACTVTFTPNFSAYSGLGILEYRGAAASPVDDTALGANFTDAVSVGPLAVHGEGNMVLAAFAQGFDVEDFTADAGFNLRCKHTDGASNVGLYVIDKLSVSTSQSPSGVIEDVVPWVGIGASFKAA